MSDKQSSIRAAIRQLQTKMLLISYAYGRKEKRKLIGLTTSSIKSITSPVIAIMISLTEKANYFKSIILGVHLFHQTIFSAYS